MAFIFAMKNVNVVVGFVAAGISLILAGFYISALNVASDTCRGACPGMDGPPVASTILLVVWIGIALLIGAPAVGLFGHLNGKKDVPPANTHKLEPRPA